MKFLKILLSWKTILLLALFLRLFGLGLNPVGLSHDDELHGLINAKSLALTAANVPGVIAGVLTQNGRCLVGDCIYGEFESYAFIPWMRIFPLNLVLSKIPFVLASVGLVWVTGKLFENLSSNATVGKLAAFSVAINPWAIYYGRTTYTYTFTFFFYVLAAYFFTRPKSYQSNLIWGGLSGFCASLFYFGAKPLLPVVILLGLVYNLGQFNARHLKFTMLFISAASIIIGGYFLVLANSQAGMRLTETGLLNSSFSLADRIQAYLGFFSPTSLFLAGQRVTDNYYLSGHGYFYIVELPFLVAGLIALSARPRQAKFLLALIATAILPAALKISPASIYSLRSALAYPLISGVIGWGLYFVVRKLQLLESHLALTNKISLTTVFLFLIGISYLISFSYFLFLYWHRLPRMQATRWFFHERVLVNYISRVRHNSNQNIIVVTARPDGIFNTYVFFSGHYEASTAIDDINNSYLSGTFAYDNVRFITDCNQLTHQELANSIIFLDQTSPVNCDLDQKNTPKIANPKDAGGMFNILNEALCSKYSQRRFPMPRSIFDFNLSDLSDETFCNLWITNPDNY